jgi:hypothetical protein
MLKCSWVGYGLFKTYSSWIDHVKHRSDLTYVLDIFEEKLPLATPSGGTILKWIR